MLKIAYYISDHGYGHAVRSIAIVRKLVQKLDDLEIIICCSKPLRFIKESLNYNQNISFRDFKNDFGYITNNELKIDYEATKNKISKWIDSWEAYLERERGFLLSRNVDFVISDIPPQPIIVADDIGVPSIAISNFTWYEIYDNLFSELKCLDSIKRAYEKTDKALILPLETNLTPFKDKKKIDLISRFPKTSYSLKRKELGIKSDENLIFLGVGKSINESKKVEIENPLKSNRSKIITFSDYNPKISDITIPEKETEGQNYFVGSDLILSKFGYGTASESIRCNVPMLLTTRDIVEDKKAIKELEELGIAKEISKEEFFEGSLDMDIKQFIRESKENYKDLPKRFTGDGTKEVIEEIKSPSV